MPRDVELEPTPLSVTEISSLLRGMFHDSSAPPAVAIEAFTTTAASLYEWCAPADVDAALETMNRPLSDLGGFVRHTDARN